MDTSGHAPRSSVYKSGPGCHDSNQNSTVLSFEVALTAIVMEKRVLFLLTSLLVFVATEAKPIPELENSDLELLTPEDTVHRAYLFWLGRPFYDQDDGGDNSYSGFQLNRRSSTVSYADVGAGWGR